VLFYTLMTALNMLFNLGERVDLAQVFPQQMATGISPLLFLLSAALNTVLIGPFLGLIIAFGEEYGWRGYLQSELTRLGRVRGVLLLGIIWGIWHWPLIWMGYNYPGQPLLGTLLMTLYTIALAFVLAYTVFKAGGIWIAAFLHALNNQTLSFFMLMIYRPAKMEIAFGIGVLGLLAFGLIVFLILRDPLWKEG
jgi:membrane protease YdiL (CAAX protease family)